MNEFSTVDSTAERQAAHKESTSDDVEKQSDNQQDPSSSSSNGGLYSHGFWDAELAPLRKAYLIGLARVTFAICLLIWAVVTIYWGSLWKSSDKTPNIHAYILNRDPNGAIGQNVTNILLSTNSNPPPHLSWHSIDPNLYPTTADVEKAVAVDQVAWIFVEILSDATVALDQARTSANASWNPTEVVRIYYSEARNQQAVDGPILGSIRGIMTSSLAQINAQSAARWLSANSDNANVLNAIASQAPQTLAGGISSSYINLRPWNEPVSIAPTFVGLIYAMILAFNITMGNFGMRQGIQRKLRFRSFVLMRLLVPIPAYFILSCMFSMINLPFKLGFGGLGYGYGAGFMIWWCFTFLGMCVLGLWTEAALSLVGPQFIGFALVFIIIINVSVANLPIELQVSLFKYGYAMPFYNLRQAYVTIIYNTGRHIELLKNMGILLAWLVVLFSTIPIWVWIERKKEVSAAAANPSAESTKPSEKLIENGERKHSSSH